MDAINLMIEKETTEFENVKEDKQNDSEPLTDYDWSFYNDHDDGC